MNPIDNPEAFERMVVGDRPSVGTVKISGHKRAWNWQVNEAKGQDGASSNNNGQVIGEFTATHFFTAEMRDEWLIYQRHLEAMVTGPSTQAWPVYHPDLEAQRYTEASVKEIGEMVHDDVGGISVAVVFIEYKPKKVRPKTKTTAKSGSQTTPAGDSAAKEDPNAAAKRELAALLEEAQSAA